MTCDVCGLPDPYRGQGDGIGSCDCPRCPCGAAAGSALCTCPPDDYDPLGHLHEEDYWDDEDDSGPWPDDVYIRPIETVHLPAQDVTR